MVNTAELIRRDLNHIWHPCTQMKDFESFPPLIVDKAQGSYLYTDQGVIIDAISSWWCKSLGHGHPAIIKAIEEQLHRFEHIIGANTTHPQLIELAEFLSQISGKQHVFFASDGSSAVEIAMKLAIHATQVKGLSQKHNFIALQNSYHGETLATMSVSDLGLYTTPYKGLGVTCQFLNNLPYLQTHHDPIWSNCNSHWPLIEHQLEKSKETLCAIIVEPIVQGAGGMLCYSPDLLKKLSQWTKQNDVYLIADEIMTGIGRTGQWLACDHAEIKADLICLSKGLTSGSIPFSCVMIDASIYEKFYSDYLEGPSFLHSHTYSGNPLGVCAALATLKTIQAENILSHATQIGRIMLNNFKEIGALTGKINNIRGVGAIVAGDLVDEKPRIGHDIYRYAVKHGALLRPMGNTLYWLPPLNTDEKTIGKLAEITLKSINKAYSQA